MVMGMGMKTQHCSMRAIANGDWQIAQHHLA